MPRAHYFLGERLAGTTNLPDAAFGRDSIAYFCQRCGVIWARIYVEGAEEEWKVEIGPCEKHQGINAIDWSKVPGSLITLGMRKGEIGIPWQARALDYLPRQLQNREVLLHIAHLERNLNAQE